MRGQQDVAVQCRNGAEAVLEILQHRCVAVVRAEVEIRGRNRSQAVGVDHVGAATALARLPAPAGAARRVSAGEMRGQAQITELDRFTVRDRLHVRERRIAGQRRSEEHTSELQSLMRISYAVFCLKKKKTKKKK